MKRFTIDVSLFGAATVSAETEDAAKRLLAEYLDSMGEILLFRTPDDRDPVNLSLSVDAEGDYTTAMDVMESEDEEDDEEVDA